VIAIFDYGAGNLRSVANTLDEIGTAYSIVRDAAGLQTAEKIILPGVGNFGQMMRSLDSLDVRNALTDRIRAGVPFLGICLGLHALFERSEEASGVQGLALYSGVVRRFAADARVPHMGWNELDGAARLLRGAGAPANLAPIVIARIETERSFFQTKDAVQSLVRGVIEAYWALVATRTEVWARRQQVQQGEEALRRASAYIRDHWQRRYGLVTVG
jgi:hypothetical protein